MSRSKNLALLVSAILFGVACEPKASKEAAKADAGPGSEKYLTADSKLTKALQSAASNHPGTDTGPPPEGVFSAGAADQRHKRGLPTKVELVNDGAEPRIAIGGGPDAGAASLASSLGLAVLELGLQVGPRVSLPTIDFAVILAAAKGSEGEGPTLLGDVKQATPAKEQPGQLPPEAEHEIGTLAGTQLVVQLTADGRASDATFKLSKAAPLDLDRVAEFAAETLLLATIPQPPRPVGVGAQWIAETRMAWSGIDVLAYRAFRVKGIEGTRLTLELDVKAYAADPNTELQGVPKGATLEQFDGQAHGELEVVRNEVVARKMEVEHRVAMVFRAPSTEPTDPAAGRPEGKVLSAQLGGQARMVRGEDLRAPPRRRGEPHELP